jgi:hypothetical protein
VEHFLLELSYKLVLSYTSAQLVPHSGFYGTVNADVFQLSTEWAVFTDNFLSLCGNRIPVPHC